MIVSKEANQLFKRLSNIRNNENKESKRVKRIADNFQGYQQKISNELKRYETRLLMLESQFAKWKENEMEQQNSQINKLHMLDNNLNSLLKSYETESIQASKKLQQVLHTTKSVMKNQYQTNLQNQRDLIGKYKHLVQVLQGKIEVVKNKQTIALDRYQRHKSLIKTSMNEVGVKLRQNTEVNRRIEKSILDELSQLRNSIDTKINTFIDKINKIYINNEMIIQQIIQDVTH